MKLKHIAYIFTILLSSVFMASCNGDDNSYSETAGSKDAMIYSFSLKGKMTNAIDSANYPVLATTLFAIDQRNGIIYNPDSLPYRTKLTKFLPTIAFASNTASTLEVIYPDSTVSWTTNDSMNFAVAPIEFKVTPLGGESKRYDIKLNVHQIDPDTIEWQQLPTIPKSGSTEQKILVLQDNVYLYTLQSSGVKVYVSSRSTVSWSPATTTNLPVTVKLGSITIFNDAFYAVDSSGDAYKSTDAISWTKTMNTLNIYSVIGILPETTAAKDSLLVVTKNGTKYYWGKTIDMKAVNAVKNINGYTSDTIPSDFLSVGFTSATNYNRTLATQNLLMVSGGRTFANKLVADTWLISSGRNNLLEASVSRYVNNNKMFYIDEDFKTFFYDDFLYALTNDSLYTSNWGYSWSKAPKKQALYPEMKTVKNMSVAVDESNYIWIAGDMTGGAVYNIWRGRLNRLRK